jgi:cytochrome P450
MPVHLGDEPIEVVQVPRLAVAAELVFDGRADVTVDRHHDVTLARARLTAGARGSCVRHRVPSLCPVQFTGALALSAKDRYHPGDRRRRAEHEGVRVSITDGPAIDFFSDPSLILDPYPYYEEVRAHGPVWQEPVHGAFVITGYDVMSAVYRDPETFSSLNSFSGPLMKLAEEPTGDDANEVIERSRGTFPGNELVGTMDPPDHTAHRGLMMRMLTPKRLQENEDFMWRLTDQVIDEFADRGSCEFIGEYAQPFALLVIADLLGIPESDHAALRAEFVAAGQPGKLGEPFPQNPLSFLNDWFTTYIEDRRRTPRDDVLTQMSRTTFPDGSMPEVVDVVRAATFLFAGGQGTSARFLGNLVQMLAEDLDLQQVLRREHERIPTVVEEALRARSPVKVNFRMARKSTVLAGVRIPAGSTLMLLVQAANRDPDRFECPAEFHIDRGNAREHVAFGRGIHSCPGGPLVRADAKITVERMLARFDEFHISEAHHGPPGHRHYDYTASWILRGLSALHLELTAAS